MVISMLLTTFVAATQASGFTTDNGCPSDIPFRYPGNNRCFTTKWDVPYCNVNPSGDPLILQQNDPQCQYSDRIFASKVLTDLHLMQGFQDYLYDTICPKSAAQMVECYRCEGAEGVCTEFMVFKNQEQLNAYNRFHEWMTPDMWSMWASSGSKMESWQTYATDALMRDEMNQFAADKCEPVLPSHGTSLDNGCPSRLSNRYPGNNRCFETVWDGEMCNVNPQEDPFIWQQADRQCDYEEVEVPPSGTVYAYSSLNDCTGGPVGSFEWSGNLGVCQAMDIPPTGNFQPGTNTYFQWWCDADVLRAAVFTSADCSGSPIRAACEIPRSASGDCHVRTNWKDGVIRSHIDGMWYFGIGGGFKFAPGEYPCSRRSLKTNNAGNTSKLRRLLNSINAA